MSTMSAGVQSIKGRPLENLKELKADELKRIITIQHRELLAKNERLKGVEELTRICNQLEEKRQDSETRADNYKTALRRAEARIAYLNKKLGIGPQTTFGIDVVNPGISRKDFDAVTRENIRLKEALEHIVSTELGGKDIIIVSKKMAVNTKL
jgi:RNase P protein component